MGGSKVTAGLHPRPGLALAEMGSVSEAPWREAVPSHLHVACGCCPAQQGQSRVAVTDTV